MVTGLFEKWLWTSLQNYSGCHQSYAGVEHPHLSDYVAFNIHCLFAIDVSRRDENMKSFTVDMKLDIEDNEGFPINKKALCQIIHDCVMEYFRLSEINSDSSYINLGDGERAVEIELLWRLYQSKFGAFNLPTNIKTNWILNWTFSV